MAFRFAAVLLTLAAIANGAMAAPADKGAIERAYAAPLHAQNKADIPKRIPARWPALANDPASPVIGNAGADVTIVEFFDYTCPYCKAVEPRLETLLKTDRKDGLVLKEFPILT